MKSKTMHKKRVGGKLYCTGKLPAEKTAASYHWKTVLKSKNRCDNCIKKKIKEL